MKWPTIKLKDAASIYTGKTPSTTDASNFNGNIPFATPSDLNGFINSTIRHVSTSGSKSLTLVRAGSSLVGCIGDVGKIGFAKVPMTFNQQINAVDWNNKLINDLFGYYVLKFLSHKIKQKAVSAVVPILNKTNFSNIEIPLPPLAEQQRIAVLLDTADQIMRQREQTIAKLDQLAQSVFVEMFGDANSTTKWERRAIRSVANVFTGKTPPTSDKDNYAEEIPFITPTDLRGIITSASRYVSIKGAKLIRTVRKGSCMVGCIGDIGRVGFVTMPVTFNQQINAVEWNSEVVDDLFGFYALKCMEATFKAQAVSAVVPILNKTNFSNIFMPVPPIEKQRKFSEFAFSLMQLKEIMKNGNEAELITSIQYQSFAVN